MRHRRSSTLAFCLLAWLSFAPSSSASGGLQVNEAATKVGLQGDQVEVSLAIGNEAERKFAAHIRLELVDPENRVRASAERDHIIPPGHSNLSFALMFSVSHLDAKEREQIIWYRLRYHITPQTPASRALSSVEGTISLSEVESDLFTLHTAMLGYAREGTRYRALLRATHPIFSRPASGVSVEAVVKFDDSPGHAGLKASGVTDLDGYVALEFNLPRDIETDAGEVIITGRRGGLVQTAEGEILLLHRSEILISTDKPLYQPGQSLLIRAMIFDESRRAIANAAATLTISDPDDAIVFRAPLRTSRFGIASASWAIPENTRLGRYRASIQMDDEKYRDFDAQQYIKITRYELPAFAVSVKPDRSYYLPGQSAEIEVRADYLFGQPVARGHVRVAREIDRLWNFTEQKWKIEEGEKYEGETDKTGKFVAHIDLTKEHEKLSETNYSRFRDVEYAAYFTDVTTGRTEQRRFDIRLTKDAIHVYVIDNNFNQAEALPMRFYLSTFYADGTPARCEVAVSEIFAKESSGSQAPLSSDVSGQTLRAIKTNAYGLAKVSDLALANRGGRGEDALLSFVARDSQGHTGHHTESFSLTARPTVRVETDKLLYRPGEPIKVSVTSTVPEMVVAVDLAQEGKVIRSEMVRVSAGRAALVFPYDRQFDGVLSIAAYSYGGLDTNRYTYPFDSRAVMYPRDRDLKLDMQLNEASYRPGEEARVNFRVLAPDGNAASSTLGVVVFDKAVEERARTDQEFGSGYDFNYSINNFLYSDSFAGVTRKDLEHLDLTKPLPEGLETVAGMLLHRGNYYPKIFAGNDYEYNQSSVFARAVKAQLEPVKGALSARYARKAEYPRDVKSLRRLLADFGIEFDKLRDPWGLPYRAVFKVEQKMDCLEFESAGADKRFGTEDDFIAGSKMEWPYFRPYGEAISSAVTEYHKRAGGYIRDEATLKRELLREGIDFEGLRDRWGKPYQLQFGISNTHFTASVISGGPDGRVNNNLNHSSDDFTIWTAEIDYFAETRVRVESALGDYFKANGRLPQDEASLAGALQRAGINEESLRDPWGHSYYSLFATRSRKADRASVYDYQRYREGAKQRTEVAPVTQQIDIVYLRSSGEDGKQWTNDDFQTAVFSQIVAEQTGQHGSLPSRLLRVLQGASGAISGVVADASGAVIPNATVKATNSKSPLSYETTTLDDGSYILGNLPAGIYEVRFEAVGFRYLVAASVPVHSSSVSNLDVTLRAGGVYEHMTVTAGNEHLMTRASQSSIVGKQVAGPSASFASMNLPAQASTPRLREYFPETLVWQPSLETDSDGRAQLKFNLADNITIWKLAVIASTTDGLIGTAEREIRAFQPFFIEHDPPRVLTEGDEIALLVVARNYLNKTQAVDLEMKPASWFTLLGPARKQAEIAAGDAARETFEFRAIASIKEGKQRITAYGPGTSDAVEKPVSVHPNGEEVTDTASNLFGDSAVLEINIPDNAIKNTARAELKIYPSLAGHVVESIEAIMQRPHGCAEQTISSAYPSILALRYYKRSGEDVPPVALKARRYVQRGYERLLGYRDAQGGFSYWGRGKADIALTGYALRFLRDAAEFITVDEGIIDSARDWLIKQQRSDGSWLAEDARRTASLTSLIARVLAAGVDRSAADAKANTDSPTQRGASSAVKRALDYLTQPVNEINEPYLIASYALAALDAGEKSSAARAIEKLRILARDEGKASYWNLESNTPFYGWGLAGRIEATALAVQSLARYCGMQGADCGTKAAQTASPRQLSIVKSEIQNTVDRAAGESSPARDSQLINRGLLFLIRQKDSYGVWLSTQATVNVLDALVTILSRPGPGNAGMAGGLRPAPSGAAEIVVNGRSVSSLTIPLGQRPGGPISVDLSESLRPGMNRVEVRRAGSEQAAVQAVSTYYRAWSATSPPGDPGPKSAAGALRFRVSFDKMETRIGEEVVCEVAAERAEHAGYGMLVAEIGLPPGAEVDRASLERAIKQSGWNLDQYEVLPDRLIVYLWPGAGGTSFQFKFRPRFGLKALTAPSLVYDYYNPEARVVLRPVKFIIQ